MALTQLMAEKPFFDADQGQIRYRLQQLAIDLKDFPYLAIWQGIDDVRTQNERRGFPETAEIVKTVENWATYIADAFRFLAY